jgi:hypothetical protein
MATSSCQRSDLGYTILLNTTCRLDTGGITTNFETWCEAHHLRIMVSRSPVSGSMQKRRGAGACTRIHARLRSTDCSNAVSHTTTMYALSPWRSGLCHRCFLDFTWPHLMSCLATSLESPIDTVDSASIALCTRLLRLQG